MYNSLSAAMLQLVNMIVGFITPKVMLVYYGSAINGLVSSILQFLTYFNLVEAGLSAAAVYALYKPLADENHKEISAVVSAARKFYNQIGIIFVLLTVALAIAYPAYIKSEELSFLEMSLLIVALGSNTSLQFFTLSKYSPLLTADQRNYVVSISNALTQILRTVMIVVFAIMGMNIVWLKFCTLLSVVVRFLILRTYTRRKYDFINYKEEPNVRALDKRWDALYLQILGAIQNGAPVVLLTILTKDLKLVSVYAIFNMVLVGINGVLGIFNNGLAASFGEVLAKKQTDVLKQAYKEFEFSYYLIASVIYSLVFALIMPFIRIYTQNIVDTNYDMPLVGFLFALSGLVANLKTPQGMMVISAGMYKETRWRSTLQGIILLIFGIVLTPVMRISGVLIASILSHLYRVVDLVIFVPKKITGTKVAGSVFRMAKMLLCVALAVLPFEFIQITPQNFVEWAVDAVFVGVYALIVVLTVNFIFDAKTMIKVVSRIKRLVKR